MKNTLAMIAAIASQTFRSAETLAEAQSVLSERIATLGEAHSILTQSSWSSAPIRAVIEGALAPHRRLASDSRGVAGGLRRGMARFRRHLASHKADPGRAGRRGRPVP